MDLLVECLVITDKYDMGSARARLRELLNKFTKEDPLRVYAIASRFGFDKEAEAFHDRHLPSRSRRSP
jgi:tRNA(Ile)-lysidine synthase TilS/MesJ